MRFVQFLFFRHALVHYILLAIPDTLFFLPAFPFSDYCLKRRKVQSATDRPKNHNKNWYDWNMIDIHSKYSIMFCIGKKCIAERQTNDQSYAYGTNRKHQSR